MNLNIQKVNNYIRTPSHPDSPTATPKDPKLQPHLQNSLASSLLLPSDITKLSLLPLRNLLLGINLPILIPVVEAFISLHLIERVSF